MKKILTLIIIATAFLSCSKGRLERKIKKTGAIEIYFDSAYICMPNIFTPNRDGLNDKLIVFKDNISWFSLEISDKTQSVVREESVYGGSNTIEAWDGYDRTGTNSFSLSDGLYTCRLTGETESGVKFDETCYTSVVSNPKRYCFEKDDDTFFGSQFNISSKHFDKSIEPGEPNNCR